MSKVKLLSLVSAFPLLLACTAQAEWVSSFDSLDQEFQSASEAYAQDGGARSPEANALFQDMQTMWGRLGRMKSSMMQGAHNGGGMGHRGGMGGGMMGGRTMTQFNAMNQQMLSYCLGMQQIMQRAGNSEMAATYGLLADKERTVLSKLPEGSHSTSASPEEPAAGPDGAATYASSCASCHGAEGRGITGVFPPLNGSSIVMGDEAVLAKIVLQGLQGPLTVGGAQYSGFMPALGSILSDAQIAGVLTYVRSLPANGGGSVTAATVQGVRNATAAHDQTWTAQELGLH